MHYCLFCLEKQRNKHSKFSNKFDENIYLSINKNLPVYNIVLKYYKTKNQQN